MLLMVYHRVDGPILGHVFGVETGLLVLVLLDSFHVVEAFFCVDLAVENAVADGAEARAPRIIWNKKEKKMCLVKKVPFYSSSRARPWSINIMFLKNVLYCSA